MINVFLTSNGYIESLKYQDVVRSQSARTGGKGVRGAAAHKYTHYGCFSFYWLGPACLLLSAQRITIVKKQRESTEPSSLSRI